MSKEKEIELAKVIEGHDGQPGENFCRKVAIISKLPRGRGYELLTRIRWGSNQGRLEEHGRHERTYRANTLDELLRVGIAESRSDEEMNDPELIQAIRSAVFEAQDAEAEPSQPTDTLLDLHMTRDYRVITDGTGKSWVEIPMGDNLGGHLDTVRRKCTVQDWQPIEQPAKNLLLIPTYAYDRVVVAGLRCSAPVV